MGRGLDSQQGEGALKFVVTGALVIAIAIATGFTKTGSSEPTPTRAAASSSELTANAALVRCRHDRKGVRFYRQRYNDHREVRGVETTWPVGRKPRNCADAHYLAEVWPDRAFDERQVTERWVEYHTLPEQGSFENAARVVQRVFPGTFDILMSCSASEGGHGIWKWNGGEPYSSSSHGSGVGGWLQFYPSTFERHFAAALEVARRLKFRVPASAHSWLSELGQALAGAWGLTYSRGEWAGSGC